MYDEINSWFGGRLPADWFTSTPALTVDRDEITVIGTLAVPDDAGDTDEARRAAEEGRIARFREQTREERIQMAREAERRFERKVAWGASCGDTSTVFTQVAAPVMTRLRQPERIVLDTLVDAGVARSRSHALAWCVRLVGQHSGDWLAELRAALSDVERLRSAGPDAAAS
ncbi:MAG: hypothetical protein JO246_11415 [Frankiaceae bacterium]|nr:hypothetical protein [Frankiaceae bacterium]MBV9870818.1 hypothetical protein [Frankiaceae bacterium]